jgi:hypothetical protein
VKTAAQASAFRPKPAAIGAGDGRGRHLRVAVEHLALIGRLNVATFLRVRLRSAPIASFTRVPLPLENLKLAHGRPVLGARHAVGEGRKLINERAVAARHRAGVALDRGEPLANVGKMLEERARFGEQSCPGRKLQQPAKGVETPRI